MTRSVNRRAFVKLAGIGALGAVAAPAVASAATNRSIKVGLLLPTGGSYARMGGSLADAFRMYFEQARVGGPVLTRPVLEGYGGAYLATQELLALGVDVVVAGVTAPIARLMTPLVAERRVPLVVANVGGHIALPADRSPYVLHHTLHYWQASFALGRWAASKLGREAFVATSRPDTGYDTVYAFRRGFESSGGSVAGAQITHERAGASGLPELFEQIGKARPSFVFANYSGPRAAEFRAEYRASGLRPRLVGPAFLAEELSGPLAKRAAGITTASSWTPRDALSANQIFQSAYRQRTGRDADAFSVLGYETAMLVAAAFRRGVTQGRLPEALASAPVDGLRGPLRVDPRTNIVRVPLHIRQVNRLGGRGVHYANEVMEVLPTVGALPTALAVLGEEQRAAYVNEILCA